MNPNARVAGGVLLAAACLVFAAWFGAHPAGEREGNAGLEMRSATPPGVRFVTVALGGFRGLLADVLWVSASELQDEGRFFEVAQLADWITRLEPRYPEVWVYHAWNMAYNITAVVPDHADRWHWVRNGIRLIRDEGIPSNPGDSKLYWELGWLYYDKVGGRWDEATLFYRISLAREMADRIGGGLVDYTRLARHPEVGRVLGTIGLAAETMKAMDEAYGPLDWRLPETHAMYWGFSGRRFQKPDARWCDRMVWMGLTESMKSGYLIYLPERKIYQQGPRLDIALKGIRRWTEEKLVADPLTALAAARFLRESTVYLHAFGRATEAQAALEEFRRLQGASGSGLPASVDSFVRQEIAQAEVRDPAARAELVVRLLVRADIWRRLAVPATGDGFDRLARLHWEALVKADPHAPGWESFTRKAREQAVREMP